MPAFVVQSAPNELRPFRRSTVIDARVARASTIAQPTSFPRASSGNPETMPTIDLDARQMHSGMTTSAPNDLGPFRQSSVITARVARASTIAQPTSFSRASSGNPETMPTIDLDARQMHSGMTTSAPNDLGPFRQSSVITARVVGQFHRTADIRCSPSSSSASAHKPPDRHLVLRVSARLMRPNAPTDHVALTVGTDDSHPVIRIVLKSQ